MHCSRLRRFLLCRFTNRCSGWARVGLGGLLGVALNVSLAVGADELAVIVNQHSGVEQLTKAEVINLFLGRQKKLPSGASALTVDLAGSNAEKQQFYARLVNKQLTEINSYWARLFFSGQESPPRQVKTTEEMLEIVKDNKGAIGYVKLTEAEADSRVRVVYILAD